MLLFRSASVQSLPKYVSCCGSQSSDSYDNTLNFLLALVQVQQTHFCMVIVSRVCWFTLRYTLCVSPAKQRELTFNLKACQDMVTDKQSRAACQSVSVHGNKLHAVEKAFIRLHPQSLGFYLDVIWQHWPTGLFYRCCTFCQNVSFIIHISMLRCHRAGVLKVLKSWI